MTELTAKELRETLAYDANTGIFSWIIRPSKAVKVGDKAGCLDKKGYVTIGIKRRIYKTHRLAWLYITGEWPNGLIDHINGNKADNRFENLRVVGADGNSQNVRKPNKRNKSGFMGVIFFQNKWRASITHKGKTHWLGDFATPEEAHQTYLVAKRNFHAACTL
jgi:hypothetical protein